MEPIRSASQKFAEVSPIHGCSYIATRGHILEGVLWALVLVVCCSFAAYDTATLLTAYNLGATAISVEMQRHVALNLSDATICFDILRPILNKNIDSVFNELAFNRSLSRFGSVASSDISKFPTDDPDFDLLMKSTYMGLARIIDYDVGIPTLGMRTPPLPKTLRAISLAMNFFENEDFSILMEQTARYLCRQIEDRSPRGGCTFGYLTQFYSTCIDVCSTSKIALFGLSITGHEVDDVCFALRNDVVPIFNFTRDSFRISSLHVERLSFLVGSSSESARIGVRIDARGGEGILAFRSVDAVHSIGTDVAAEIGVQITSRFLALNQNRSPCSAYSQPRCALRCLVAKRNKTDGCFPLVAATETRAATTPICSKKFSNDEILTFERAANSSAMSRWDECLLGICGVAPCDTVSYDYKVISQSVPAAFGAGTNIILSQAKFVYPIMKEYLVMDFSTLLSNFGGVLGLWFGGSLIALAHIPIFVGIKLIDFYTSRSAPSGPNQVGHRLQENKTKEGARESDNCVVIHM